MVRGERLSHPARGSDNHRPRLEHHDDAGTLDAGHHPDHRGSVGTDEPGSDLSATHRSTHHQPSADQSSNDVTATAADHNPDDHGLRILSL